MKDSFGRTIDYLRVSVTDRCNLRCIYCMPEGCDKVSMAQILTYEEIERICRIAASAGISKIKVTGGEPLVRLGCCHLIRSLKSIEGVKEVTLTTNGQILGRFLDELRDAGIDGINISLDSLKPERYSRLTGGGSLGKTLEAIDLARASGIRTKINSVLLSGVNEDEILSLAGFTFRTGLLLRFIELMPIGIADSSLGISNEKVLKLLLEKWPDLEADSTPWGNGPAVYYRRPGIRGGIGLISAIHGKFCAGCNRIRLTSQGQIKPCLCYEEGFDLKPYLRKSDTELEAALKKAILMKPLEHCFPEEGFGSGEHRLMSQIGG